MFFISSNLKRELLLNIFERVFLLITKFAEFYFYLEVK
jgi:hypothetical protein